MRQFYFLDYADDPLFIRSDAESASWNVEEMNLQATFPYDPQRIIRRGQRIAFWDDTGVFQAFEIRKCRNYSPDNYQEITAEHIVISELTDEHTAGRELTDVALGDALNALLDGTLWSVGSVYNSSDVSSADIGMGSVWQALRSVEQAWPIRLVPRVTAGPAGITGRYIDAIKGAGTWDGIRLSVNKNADEMGVTWDDSNVVTALYGYGANVTDEEAGTIGGPLMFTNIEWAQTVEHPAKPAGYGYIEDPAATALYGRNGHPRFGYYQNGDIRDAETLLEKTWEALKLSSAPTVTIDCQVRDLYRLGYHDEPLKLYALARVEVHPGNEVLERQITSLSVDLLDPTATRVTIGTYIPNIIYISRDTAAQAYGSYGGGGGGSVGNRRGQSNAQKARTEFNTEIAANAYQISLRATHEDLETAETDLRGEIQVEAGRITQIVEAVGENGTVTAASIVLAVNAAGSSVMISADKIILDGQTLVAQMQATNAKIANLISGQTLASKLYANDLDVVNVADINSLTATSAYIDTLNVMRSSAVYQTATWQTDTVVSSVSITLPSMTTSSPHYFMFTENGATYNTQGMIVQQVFGGSVSVGTKTIYYLGTPSS